MVKVFKVHVNIIPEVVLTGEDGDYQVEWAGHLVGRVQKTCDTSGSATRWRFMTWDGYKEDGWGTRNFALQKLLHAVEERDSG